MNLQNQDMDIVLFHKHGLLNVYPLGLMQGARFVLDSPNKAQLSFVHNLWDKAI